MLCKKCGETIDDDSLFCNKCGCKIEQENKYNTTLVSGDDTENKKTTEGNNAQLWYYVIENERKGPVTEIQLKDLVRDGFVNRKSLIWREGYSGWLKIEDSEIRYILNGSKKGGDLLGENKLYIVAGVVFLAFIICVIMIASKGSDNADKKFLEDNKDRVISQSKEIRKNGNSSSESDVDIMTDDELKRFVRNKENNGKEASFRAVVLGISGGNYTLMLKDGTTIIGNGIINNKTILIGDKVLYTGNYAGTNVDNGVEAPKFHTISIDIDEMTKSRESTNNKQEGYLSIDELKGFVRNNDNIGKQVTFRAKVLAAYYGNYMLMLKDGTTIMGNGIDKDINVLTGDEVLYTGKYLGVNSRDAGLGIPQFSTVSIEIDSE